MSELISVDRFSADEFATLKKTFAGTKQVNFQIPKLKANLTRADVDNFLKETPVVSTTVKSCLIQYLQALDQSKKEKSTFTYFFDPYQKPVDKKAL